MKVIFKRILKTLITSFFVCFFSGIILFIANKIMGVGKISPIVYLLLGILCFVMLSVGIIFAKADYIFNKEKPKHVNKNINTKEKTKARPKNIQRKNRKRKVS